ncbi:hypothetical protein ACOSP7_028672 [Xanthoceras sorbifolium]
MTWLVNSMTEDISGNYMCYSTAKELWDNVNQMYSDLGNQSQVYELTLKLGDIRQGNDNVTKYFNSLKRLWQDLDLFNYYEWKSIEDANYNKKTVEAHRIYKFLAGLNVEFDEVRGRIIGRSPLPPIGEVFAEVRREESRRSVMLGKSSSSGTVETSALLVSETAANKAEHHYKKSDEKPRAWCDFCNRPRHTRETCWKLHGKPANWKSSRPSRAIANANEAEISPFSKEQMNQLLKLLKSNSSSGMDVSFLENKPYFQKNSLQGEKQEVEDNFWDLSCVPLPNTILNTTLLSSSNSEENFPKLPNIDVSSTGGEMLQNTELQVYTRKGPHQKNKNPPIIPEPDQSSTPRTEIALKIPNTPWLNICHMRNYLIIIELSHQKFHIWLSLEVFRKL